MSWYGERYMGKVIVIGVIILVLVGVGIGGGRYLTAHKAATKNTQPMEAKTTVERFIPTPTTEMVDEEHEEDENAPAIKFAVSAKNSGFIPSMLKVAKGERVQVVFTSVGGSHSWNVDEFEVGTNVIGDGEEEEVEFVADKAGTFEFYSLVNENKEAGMSGKLIVE